ncbi:Pectate lyase [Bertholletia excelsa]
MMPSLHAHVAEEKVTYTFDQYWDKKAKDAEKRTSAAYDADPLGISNKLNQKVNRMMLSINGTRRGLKQKHKDECLATNPIDKCWRCRSNWMENRKRLADCVLGFGYKTTGGKDGDYYVVTDPSDDYLINPRPGTLRHAVIQKEPLWIVFGKPIMIIKLKQELLISSNKTIDARGSNVHIANGAGITIQFAENVIIHGLHIHDILPGRGGFVRDSVDHFGWRTRSDGDGISLFGASNIWIDHVSMSNCTDGLIDAIMGSTAITISNGHYTHHNEVMLFGANDLHVIDNKMQITVAFNHFGKGLVQRMPRVRRGFVHVVNNDYTHWLMYAIGGSAHPTIICQGNRFIAPPDPNAKQVTMRVMGTAEKEWRNWQWKSQGDVMQEGAYFVESGPPLLMTPFSNSKEMIKAYDGSMASTLTQFAGPLSCRKNKPC